MEPNQESASNVTDIAGDEGPRVNPIFSSVMPGTPSSPTGPASPSLQPISLASSTDNQQTTQAAAGSLAPSLGPSPTPSSDPPPRQEEAPAVVGSIVSEPVAVIAYPVQDYDDGMVVAYAVGRGYYPEPTFDGEHEMPRGQLRIGPLEGLDYEFPLRGRWQDGMFVGCFRQFKPTCLMATFCSCVLISQLAERVRWAVGYRSLMFGWTILYLIIWVSNYSYPAYVSYPVFLWLGLTWSLVWHVRWHLRTKYQIPGHCLCDMLASICCNCCTVAQMARHVFYHPACCDDTCDCGPPMQLP